MGILEFLIVLAGILALASFWPGARSQALPAAVLLLAVVLYFLRRG